MPGKHVWAGISSDGEVQPDTVSFIEDVSVSWSSDFRENCDTSECNACAP